MRGSWAALVAVVVAIGCDDHVLGVPVEEVPAEPAYRCDWEGVRLFLGDHCAACHARRSDGELGSGGVELTEEIEAELRGETDGYVLVVPGDAAGSLLWQSIAGTGTGPLMPYGFTDPLAPHQIEHIACWIDGGAPL